MPSNIFAAGFGEIPEELDMLNRFSDQEAAILLGATLMHWGVPFRRAPKRPLTNEEQEVVDETSNKLIHLREQNQKQVSGIKEIDLSDKEAALLVQVMEDCLNECGSDSSELSLQLKTSVRSDVETLLKRLRPKDKPFQRIGGQSNTAVGDDFEAK